MRINTRYLEDRLNQIHRQLREAWEKKHPAPKFKGLEEELSREILNKNVKTLTVQVNAQSLPYIKLSSDKKTVSISVLGPVQNMSPKAMKLHQELIARHNEYEAWDRARDAFLESIDKQSQKIMDNALLGGADIAKAIESLSQTAV